MRKLSVLLMGLTVGLVGCGVFDGLPEHHTAQLEPEVGLSGYEEASATVELHFVTGEIHVTLTGMPPLDEDCLYTAFATTDADTTELGTIERTAEEHHDEDGEHHEGDTDGDHAEEGEPVEAEHHPTLEAVDPESAEETHYSGELVANMDDFELDLYEITAIECFLECTETPATLLFSVDFAAEADAPSGGTTDGGGHTH